MYRFEHIEAFYLLSLAIIILLLYFTYKQWKKKKFKNLAEAHLLEHIVKGRSKSKTIAKFIISLLIFTLLILSIANLQIGGKLEKKAHAETIDLILIVDISRSMLAEDIKPNRIERAKFIAMKLAEEVRFAKIGIVLFAAEAFMHMPITSDPGAVRKFINSIETNLISLQGTAMGRAIQVATDAFNRTEARNKAVVIISDGENFEDDAIQAASLAIENNIVIHSISIGTAEGAPIPIKEKGKIIGFHHDKDGNTVITKPDLELLSQVAIKTGGISVDGNQPGFAVAAISDELKKLEREQGEAMQFADWDSLYYLFAIPALIFLVLDFLIVERKMRWQQIFDSLMNFSITKKQNLK